MVTEGEEGESEEQEKKYGSKHTKSLTPNPSPEERGVYSFANSFFIIIVLINWGNYSPLLQERGWG